MGDSQPRHSDVIPDLFPPIKQFLDAENISHATQYDPREGSNGRMFWLNVDDVIKASSSDDLDLYKKFRSLSMLSCRNIWEGVGWTQHMQKKHGYASVYAAREVAASLVDENYQPELSIEEEPGMRRHHSTPAHRGVDTGYPKSKHLLLRGSRNDIQLGSIQFHALLHSLTQNDLRRLPINNRLTKNLPNIEDLQAGDLLLLALYAKTMNDHPQSLDVDRRIIVEVNHRLRQLTSIHRRIPHIMKEMDHLIPHAASLTRHRGEEEARNILRREGLPYSQHYEKYSLSWNPIVVFGNLADYCSYNAFRGPKNEHTSNLALSMNHDFEIRSMAGSLILLGYPITAYRDFRQVSLLPGLRNGKKE